jgi:hypothetical protein
MTLRREIRWCPGYDKTAEGKGRHGLDIRWYVHGELGTVQFVLSTHWIPSWVREGRWGREVAAPDKYLTASAVDLGYHWRFPQYEGQPCMGECDVLHGAICYYDGSGLHAEDVFARLLTDGEEAVWAVLEARYHELAANKWWEDEGFFL